MSKYIIREVPAEEAQLRDYFDGDVFNEYSGDFCNTLFIVHDDGKGSYGLNGETYRETAYAAQSLSIDFEHPEGSYKEIMDWHGIPYNPTRCHKLKEWVKVWGVDTGNPNAVAEYLTITTGKPWDVETVFGYCQGDYVSVVYCKANYSQVKLYGQIYLGCAKEFTVTELGDDGTEIDTTSGYIVADCQVQSDEDYKRIACWDAGIPEEDSVLKLIESYRVFREYFYKTIV